MIKVFRWMLHYFEKCWKVSISLPPAPEVACSFGLRVLGVIKVAPVAPSWPTIHRWIHRCSLRKGIILHRNSVPMKSTAVSYDDAVSSISLNTVEHCIRDRFKGILRPDDNWMGFGNNLGCSHSVRFVCKTLSSAAPGNTSCNSCAIAYRKYPMKKSSHFAYMLVEKVNLLETKQSWG